MHGCLPAAPWDKFYHINIEPTSPESGNSSISLLALSSAKPKVLEIVRQVAEKYEFLKTTPSLFEPFGSSVLIKYRREQSDEKFLIDMSVIQMSNYLYIWFREAPRLTRSKIGKQIQAELMRKLSESLGKEFIITE